MWIKEINIRTEPIPPEAEQLPGGFELTVSLQYFATPDEAQKLGALLTSGERPPKAFWDALDWGDVRMPGDRALPRV
jgi:hypothetical protein